MRLLHENITNWKYYFSLPKYKKNLFGYQTWGDNTWSKFPFDLKQVNSRMSIAEKAAFILFCYNLNLVNKAIYTFCYPMHTYSDKFMTWYLKDTHNLYELPFNLMFGYLDKLSPVRFIIDTPCRKDASIRHSCLEILQNTSDSLLKLIDIAVDGDRFPAFDKKKFINKIISDDEPFSIIEDDVSFRLKQCVQNAL